MARAVSLALCCAAAASAAGGAPRPLGASVRAVGIFSKKMDSVLTGELHSLVLGISNEGDRPVNLTVVQAWLEHPQDPSQRLWNFSRQMVGEVLEAGRETAIEYRLPVPRMAEASQDVRLVAVVQYADTARAARWAVVTAYNSSLTFAANPLPFDVRAYSPYVLATLVLAGAAMLFRELLTSSGKKSKAAGAYDVADDEPTVAVVPGGRQRRKNDKA